MLRFKITEVEERENGEGLVSFIMWVTSEEELKWGRHVYDAKRHAQMGHAAHVSSIAHLVGIQRTVQNNGNVTSEPNYLACSLVPRPLPF